MACDNSSTSETSPGKPDSVAVPDKTQPTKGTQAPARPLTFKDRVKLAQKLLAEAGYPKGKGFPEIEILYNTGDAHEKIAAAIQYMWKKHLGIKVTLANTEWKSYLDQLSKLDYQVARRGWIGDYNDPNTFLEMYSAHSGNNNTGWTDPEYEKLLEQQNSERDPDKRRGFMERMEAILMRDMPVVPIYFYVTQEMYRHNVQGWYQNLQSVHPLNEVYHTDGKTLVVNNHTEIQTLDPGIARGVPEHRIQIGLYEGLMNYHPETNRPIPGVAHKWEISDDGLTYKFFLRECVWSDGEPVTAHDFEYAWKRVLDPATASDYAHQLYYIKGGKEFNTSDDPDPSVVGIKVIDDRTLVVELENPTPYFLDLMPFFTFYPVRKDKIEEFGPKWTSPRNHVGNGPFSLKEWIPNHYLRMEKNPRYWNADKVKQQEIKFLPTKGEKNAFDLYTAGECDIITSVPLEFITKLIKRPDYHSSTYLGTYYYSFNITKKPFDDVRVRRALALAFDRNIIVNKITRGGQKAAYHYVPPVFPGFSHTRFDRK